MNIAKLFFDAAKRYPDNVAIVESNRQITYEELALQVKQTASHFKSKGLKKGDRVLVFVPMSIDLYRIVLALFSLGATAVFLDEWVSMKRLELCCKLANCRAFIGGFKARMHSYFSAELRKTPIKLNLKFKAHDSVTMEEVNPDSPALITFTTGSTGTPKAALRSHDFLNEQFKALLDEIEPKVSDIDMPVLPIVLFVNLGVGCTSVIADFKMTQPTSLKPAKILHQLNKNSVNRITASPFFVRKLAEHCLSTKSNVTGLKKIFTGGAPVFPNEAALYNRAFPETKSVIVYGSTEAEPISSIDSAQLDNQKPLKKGLPVGIPYHKAQVKIIRIDPGTIDVENESEFDQWELPKGEIGEILVEGPHVLKSYFNNDLAFRQNKIKVNRKIWHRTGDSGYMEDGHLFLTGRCQQLIYSNQQILSPFIVESQLQAIEGIRSGTLLSNSGAIVLAVETHLSLDEVKLLVKGIPYDRIELLQRIPKDPRHHSKIDYKKLKISLK